MVKPDEEGVGVFIPMPIEQAAPSPKRIVVVCQRCGGEVEMRPSDGMEYHVAGEADHEPIPVATR